LNDFNPDDASARRRRYHRRVLRRLEADNDSSDTVVEGAGSGGLREDEVGSLASTRDPCEEERAAGPSRACVAGCPQHSQSPESPSLSQASQTSIGSPGQVTPADVLAQSFCIKCSKEVANISRHMVRRHQKGLTADEAKLYGFSLCSCGVFAKGIEQHWSQWCSLPRLQRKAVPTSAPPEESISLRQPVEASPALDAEPLTGIELLFSVLRDNQASPQAINDAFQVLAKLPAATKIWKPAETSLINECVS